MSLFVIPSLKARALIVLLALITKGPVYVVDEAEGSEPSAVYLIVTPDVEQVSVTL